MNLLTFFREKLWQIDEKSYSWPLSFLLRSLKIFTLSLRGFQEDRCDLRASALTFYSLLSIVPVLAMAFGISKGFSLDLLLEKFLLEHLHTQQVVVGEAIHFAKNLLENSQGGIIAGTGVLTLMWTVIKVLNHVEDSFNTIWGVREGRSWKRKGADYLALILICPILLLISQGTTLFIMQNSHLLSDWFLIVGPLGKLLLISFKFLPYLTAWALLTFLFLFMPNTKVKIGSALFAGVIAGSLVHFFQWIYITFQIGISHYGAIYGSFAALPLFLIWLHMNWYIVLYGAELAFSHQNVALFECEERALEVSDARKRLFSLRLVQHLVKNFSSGIPPQTAFEISQELQLPIRLVQRLIKILVESGLFLETMREGNRAYHLSCDINKLTITQVIEALDHHGSERLSADNSSEVQALLQTLTTFEKHLQEAKENKLLKDL